MASKHEHICAMTREVLPHAIVPCMNFVQLLHVEDTSLCHNLLKATAQSSWGHVNVVMSVNSPVHVLIAKLNNFTVHKYTCPNNQ